MFDSLSDKFGKAINFIKGKSIITEKDFENFSKSLRRALLEADVALPVIKEFIKDIKERAVGQSVVKNFSSADSIAKVVKDVLIKILGDKTCQINLIKDQTSFIMMVGLQGSGKTTTSAKLALFLKKRKKKKVLLCSVDVYRPAAQKQLEVLAKQIDVDFVPIVPDQKPGQIIQQTLNIVQNSNYDAIIIDTAGRLQIDQDLMQEICDIKSLISPSEVLLVMDAMTGQESLNIAKKFNQDVCLTGVVMTRIDSDTRGGASLSVKHATGVPIKFLGSGEAVNEFEEFHPDRMAGRILGMGDVDSLMERASEEIGEKKIDDLKKKLDKGKFDFNDLLSQFKAVSKLGGIAKIVKMIPGINKLPTDQMIDETLIKKNLAMIGSMTNKERSNPEIINQSRKSRIAKGAGVKASDMNKLMKNFDRAKSMAAKFSKGGFGSVDKEDISSLLKK